MTLKQMRVVQGYTQRDMAEKMGVDINTIRAWERCPAKIQVGKLFQILKYLGYSIGELQLFNSTNTPYLDFEDEGE